VIRYYAIATVIVLSIVIAVTAYADRDLIRIKIASVYASVPPKPAAMETIGARSPRPFVGVVAWALSALPECLLQTEIARGTISYVRNKLPRDAQAIAPPATLEYGDCTIVITADRALVRRGDDRLSIPPSVRFLRSGNRLYVLRTAEGTAELRVYQPSPLQ
jgi:hypothetical protein